MTHNHAVKARNWSIANLVAYFLVLGINYLASSGFFNDTSQVDVSDKYTTLITPAGFAFSIWGVIYILLLATLGYFLVKRKDKAISDIIIDVSPLFIISSLFNIAWIIAFSYLRIGLSTLFILGLLFSLLFIVEKLYKKRSNFSFTLAGTAFSLYSAWVFIATIVNVSVYLVQLGWSGFGISESIWTVLILLVAIGFAIFYLSQFKNAVFPLPLAWAFIGIYGSYMSGRLTPDMAGIIQILLLVGIVILLSLSGVVFFKNNKAIFPK